MKKGPPQTFETASFCFIKLLLLAITFQFLQYANEQARRIFPLAHKKRHGKVKNGWELAEMPGFLENDFYQFYDDRPKSWGGTAFLSSDAGIARDSNSTRLMYAVRSILYFLSLPCLTSFLKNEMEGPT
ncbi:MAG TPA: hypothetical protein VK658_15010 [Chryseolinea sp.]|nr:hypothetical protein [Chryseolinea sp.]